MSYASHIADPNQSHFYYLHIEGIPYLFSTHKTKFDGRGIETALTESDFLPTGSGYTVAPWIMDLPLSTDERVDFKSSMPSSPSSMAISIQDYAGSVTALVSMLTVNKTKLNEALDTSETTIDVDSTALLTSPVFCGRETIKFTGTSGGNQLTGCTRGAYASTAATHADGDAIANQPRWWAGRRAYVYHAHRKEPSTAQVVFRGAVADVREQSPGLFEIVADDMQRVVNKPLFDNMRGQAMHWGAHQVTVDVPSGNMPKDPGTFQVSHNNFVFPVRTDYGAPMGVIKLEDKDLGGACFFSDFKTSLGTGTECAVTAMPLANGDFDEWGDEEIVPYFVEQIGEGVSQTTAQHVSDTTDYEVVREDIAREINTTLVVQAPYCWRVTAQIADNGPGAFVRSSELHSPSSGEAGRIVHKRRKRSCHFGYGPDADHLGNAQIEQRVKIYETGSHMIMWSSYSATAGTAFVTVKEAGQERYYDFGAGTWTTTGSCYTIALSAADNWATGECVFHNDTAKIVELRIGNTRPGGTLVTTAMDWGWHLDDVQLHTPTTGAAVADYTGAKVLTFFNCNHALGYSYKAGKWEDSLDQPKRTIKECMMLRGSPLNVARCLLQSVDGNVTDDWDVLPSGWCAGLSSSDIDEDSFDKAAREYVIGGGGMWLIDEPFQLNEFLAKEIYAPNFIYPVTRSAGKYGLAGLACGLPEFNQTAHDFAASLTIDSNSKLLAPLVVSHGCQNVSNQLKWSVNYNLLKDIYLTNLIFNATGESATYYGAGRQPHEIKSKSQRFDMNTLSEYIAKAQLYFQRFAHGMQLYKMRTSLQRLADAYVGDMASITQSISADIRAESRGLSADKMLIVGKRVDWREGTIEWDLSPLPLDTNPAYISPCMFVSNSLGDPVLVVEENYYTTSSDKDIKHFRAGDKVTVWETDLSASEDRTIASIDYDAHTVTLNSAIGALSNPGVITFDAYGDCTTTQHQWAFYSGTDNLIVSTAGNTYG